MSKQKGTPKTGGRAAGTPNRAQAVREMMYNALESAGGQLLLNQTAVKNPEGFLKVLATMMPKQVELEGDLSVNIIDRIKEARERARSS